MSRGGSWRSLWGQTDERNEWPITGMKEFLRKEYDRITSDRPKDGPKRFPRIEVFEDNEFVAVKEEDIKNLIEEHNKLIEELSRLRKEYNALREKENKKKSEAQQLEELMHEGISKAQAAAEAERHKAAERNFEGAKTYYDRMQEAEAVQNDRLVPLRKPFERLMGALACFAGCREEADYPDLEISMENARQTIKTGLRQWEDCLASLTDIPIPDYPELQPPVQEEPADNHESPLQRDFQCVQEQYEQGDISYADAVKCLKRLTDSIPVQEADAGGLKTGTEELKNRTKVYLREGEKTARWLNKWEWAHAQLLRELLPLLKEVARAEEETTAAQWADTAREIRSVTEKFRCKGLDVRYLWVFPGDPFCRESEEIRLTFMAGEARWPGLFCCENGDSSAEKLKCVINGRVLGAGIR